MTEKKKMSNRTDHILVKKCSAAWLLAFGLAWCLPAVRTQAAQTEAADNIITQEYDSGLVLGTKITPQDDGSWLVTLEAYLKSINEANNAALDTEAVQAAAAGSRLSAQAQLREVIAGDFRLKDPDDIRTYTSRCCWASDGSAVWEEPVPEKMNIHAFSYRSFQGKTDRAQQDYVKISGFDFENRAVSRQPQPGTTGDCGSKLIVKFSIVQDRTFGGRMPASVGGVSGIYVSDGAEEPAGIFPVPLVDVPIRYSVSASDRYLYTNDLASLAETLSFAAGCIPDGENNMYVNIHYEIYETEEAAGGAFAEAGAGNGIEGSSFDSGAGGFAMGTLDIPAGKKAGMCDWVWNGTGQTSAGGRFRVRCVVTPSVPGSGDCLLLEDEVNIHLLPATFSLNPDEAQRQLQKTLMEARSRQSMTPVAAAPGTLADTAPSFEEQEEKVQNVAGITDHSPEERVLPQTGDDQSIIPWILIAAAAVALTGPVLSGCVLAANESK